MPASRRTRLLLPVAFLLATLVVGLVTLLVLAHLAPALLRPPAPHHSASVHWPATGQAAYWVEGTAGPATSGPERPVPIASVTKMMTALVSLEQAPLADRDGGFSTTVTAADLDDTEERRARGESVVPVQAGDRINERQALLGLLLPSAGNLAHLLATRTAPSEAAFVRRMNDRAASLGMRHTSYVDVSGYDPGSQSTAYDQTLLARAGLQNPTFAWLVGQQQAELPTTGLVTTTDQLLGRDGFVGVKTGYTTSAGGCFVFASRRLVDGRSRLVVGAVLGQRERDPTLAAFRATEALVDSLGPP